MSKNLNIIAYDENKRRETTVYSNKRALNVYASNNNTTNELLLGIKNNVNIMGNILLELEEILKNCGTHEFDINKDKYI
jgi:hypothetical protein